ncbi:hypothetical protein K435DRAFT_797791, partial [Dendrothele bispora CBS 962.96]
MGPVDGPPPSTEPVERNEPGKNEDGENEARKESTNFQRQGEVPIAFEINEAGEIVLEGFTASKDRKELSKEELCEAYVWASKDEIAKQDPIASQLLHEYKTQNFVSTSEPVVVNAD